MPSVWFASLCFVSLGIGINLENWIYPTRFWFVNAIFFFFILFYFFDNYFEKHKKATIITITLIYTLNFYLNVDYQHIVMDEGGVKIWPYCFIFMLLGHWAAHKKDCIKGNYISFIISFTTLCIFFVYKSLAAKYSFLCTIQFAIIPLLLYIFTWYFYKGCIKISKISIPEELKHMVSKISNMTLDIYVVQIVIFAYLNRIEYFWPIKIFIAILWIASMSYFSYTFSVFLNKKIRFWA